MLRVRCSGSPSLPLVANGSHNAMAESFMKTLKVEEVHASQYNDLEHARSAIGAFIETVYNRQRLHSALAYQSPEEFEASSLGVTARTIPWTN